MLVELAAERAPAGVHPAQPQLPASGARREVCLEPTKPVLLVVEDDLDIADMLNAYFRVKGYEVLTVNWGEDGVRACHNMSPDLVILDIRLPDIDGFEVARRLRTSRKTANIPIIFATEKRERKDRLQGLQLQADDYVVKPFDIQELGLRVRNSLARSQQQPISNSITGLPVGLLVDEALAAALTRPAPAFTVATIQNMARFREVYGFVAADDLLRAVSLILKDAFAASGAAEQFIGHLHPESFLLISDREAMPALKERLRKKLEPAFEFFYSEQHRQEGLFASQPLGISFSDPRAPQVGFQSVEELKVELLSLCP